MNPTLQALLRENFFSFARKAVLELEGTKLGHDPYLRYLARELDLFAGEETHRLIINLPPGHLKTLLASVSLAAWLLAHDPSLKIIIITHAEHLSKTIARNIRTILQADWFNELFATRIRKGHAEVTDFGTTSGGGVFVSSFHGRITGRRAHVIIVDDPHDIDDELEQIESTIESFNNVLLSRLNDRKTGRVLVVAHRVHERDLSAYLLQKKKKKWKHVVLPLVATEDQTYETASGIWRRRKGELLRPDVFGPEDLDDLRESSFNPDFEMLYQQDFDFQALPAIRADHFGTFFGPMPASGLVVLSIDAGMTKGPRSAYSVIQVWSLTGDAYYLVDQFREQTTYAELRDNVRHFRKTYRPAAILIERAANGHALFSDLSRKHSKLLIPIDPDGRSKSARLRVHADTIIAKRICLPAHATWRDDFVKEFVEFPNGKFTDQVDATTQFLDHAVKFAGLEPSPQAGLAAAVNRSGHIRAISPSIGHERGVAAAVCGNGQPITNGQSNLPILSIKTEIKY
jgi:predicted phage terminase large subunit-like protein